MKHLLIPYYIFQRDTVTTKTLLQQVKTPRSNSQKFAKVAKSSRKLKSCTKSAKVQQSCKSSRNLRKAHEIGKKVAKVHEICERRTKVAKFHVSKIPTLSAKLEKPILSKADAKVPSFEEVNPTQPAATDTDSPSHTRTGTTKSQTPTLIACKPQYRTDSNSRSPHKYTACHSRANPRAVDTDNAAHA
jgi:hypothetical protein